MGKEAGYTVGGAPSSHTFSPNKTVTGPVTRRQAQNTGGEPTPNTEWHGRAAGEGGRDG